MHLIRIVSVLLLGAAACTKGAGDGSAGARDSAADSGSVAGTERAVTPFRLANDGTLTVLTMSPLTRSLRTAADSFSVREAVRVLLDTIPSLRSGDSLVVRRADVVAISSTILSHRLIDVERASWSLPFARNRVVLAWTDSSRRAADIDSSTWRRIIVRRDTRVGRVDPARAAMGVNTLLAMQLAESHLGEKGLARRLFAASPAKNIFPTPDSLVAALRAHTLDVVWTYESVAREAGLRWLNLGAPIDLGDAGASARYDSASTIVTVSRPAPDSTADSTARVAAVDSFVVRGEPLHYALTIPRESANLALAERFVRFLFSTDGQRILRTGTFDLIDPLVVVGRDVPGAVAAIADSVSRASAAGDAALVPRP